MTWPTWIARGIFSGALVVAASELAKRSTLYGALLISIPFLSILSILWLYNDTNDTERVADYAEGILWLVIPSLCLFFLLPYLLRRGWNFETAFALGIFATVCMYIAGAYAATALGNVEA